MSNFDLIVIGSGPGGYVAAIRASQLGLRTALVEKNGALGGTCLNVGCIPSKSLLYSSEQLSFLQKQAAHHGIVIGEVSVDLDAMMKRKDAVVKRMRDGIAALLKGNKVSVIQGRGTLVGPGKVRVAGGEETRELEAAHIILATGSTPTELPGLPFDGKQIVSSDQAVAFDSVPERLVVIGAGAIGLELGAVWHRLGSDVTLVEFLPRIAPTFDDDICRLALRLFKKQGLKFELSTKVTGSKSLEDGRVVLRAEQDGKKISMEAEKVLVAVGRRPFTEDLGLESVGLKTDAGGRIPVNESFRTEVEGLYAIGDVIAGPMLAHKAEEEGIACVERIAGQAGQISYHALPNVIYTHPEMASAGLGEEEARKQHGDDIRVGKFNLQANSRAVALDAGDGMVKVIAHPETDRILGVQILAPNASELIAEVVAHMEYGGSAEDLGRSIHAHPTLAEAVKEAALAVSGNAIHSMAAKR